MFWSIFHFVRVLLHNELELAASKASLDYMKAAMAELAACRNERQRAKEILIMKHKKIQDFERLAVSCLNPLTSYLISPHNITAESNKGQENKGNDHKLKTLLIVHQILLSFLHEM